MRLGVLQRFIIVTTAFWILCGTAFLAISLHKSRVDAAQDAYELCVKGANLGAVAACGLLRSAMRETDWDTVIGEFATLTLGTAVVFWGVVLVVLTSIKWVIAGRDRP